MAKQGRRPTQWLAKAFESAISPDETTRVLILSAAQLTEHTEEPTLVRTFGRITSGGSTTGFSADFTARSWWAIYLGDINGDPLPDLSATGLEDERIICSGFLLTVWQDEFQVYYDGSLVQYASVTSNQAGPWQMADFESSAMRKVRQGDSLILQFDSTLAGNEPASYGVSGFIRVLIKE